MLSLLHLHLRRDVIMFCHVGDITCLNVEPIGDPAVDKLPMLVGKVEVLISSLMCPCCWMLLAVTMLLLSSLTFTNYVDSFIITIISMDHCSLKTSLTINNYEWLMIFTTMSWLTIGIHYFSLFTVRLQPDYGWLTG